MITRVVSSAIVIGCAALLGACGADVAGSAAAQAGQAAERVEEGRKMQRQIEQGLEDAQAAAEERRRQLDSE